MTKKEAWKTESFDGAFLFLLLHKRIAGHPDNYSAAEIQANPDYPFGKYPAQTFKRSCQTVAKKVKQFESKKTGITKGFKRHLAEVLKEKEEYFEANEDGFCS